MTDEQRKQIPVYSGFIAYFPRAIREIARVSNISNEQHNAGEPLHWAKEKSPNELDSMMRHLCDKAQGIEHDELGVKHEAKVAWRAMANLERSLECEEKGLTREELVEYYKKEKEEKTVTSAQQLPDRGF